MFGKGKSLEPETWSVCNLALQGGSRDWGAGGGGEGVAGGRSERRGERIQLSTTTCTHLSARETSFLCSAFYVPSSYILVKRPSTLSMQLLNHVS